LLLLLLEGLLRAALLLLLPLLPRCYLLLVLKWILSWTVVWCH
jgi:hypothetical protein